MLLYDIGKPFSYQDDGNIRCFKCYAKKLTEISKNILDRFYIPNKNKSNILNLIELHSAKIEINEIDIENKEFYKRLLKIQIFNAKGYEIEHSKKIIDRLNMINIK